MSPTHPSPPGAAEQFSRLQKGVVQTYSPDELRAKLSLGRPLRIKLGFDPSAPDIHLGHTVVLRKLREFQELGHQAVVIVGDFTAMIGDPSGRSKTRPALTPQDVEAHARTYFEQVGRILDVTKTEIVRNSQWLKPLSFFELIHLASKMTVARFLERDDFQKRYREGTAIGLHEFFYPLMQAYDSVKVRADVELGGTDQTFNILMARELMRDSGMEPQVAMTLPILRGLDGVQKMSKSLDNYIGVTEGVFEKYSKVMSLPDDLMKEYFTLLTALPVDEVDRLCDAGKTHPKSAKDRLAREIAATFDTREAVDEAAARWDQLFSKRERPGEIPVLKVGAAQITVLDAVMKTGIPKSRSEARRLIEQGGVEVDDQKLTDPMGSVDVAPGRIFKVGKKRRFFRIEV